MPRKFTTGMLVGLLIAASSASFAQRGRDRDGGGQTQTGTIDYNDLSRRNTARTEREDRKAKEAEAAKKKAEEEKRRQEREKRNEEDARRRGATGATTIQARGTTTGSKEAASRTAARAGAQRATQPVNTGGSTDPTTKEVTEVMLNAVKTHRVQFDMEAAKNNPDVILLNPPRFDPTERTRAGDAGIAAPL